MYRVLLADDENTILEGLLATVDWQAMNCLIVAIAHNGNQLVEEALQFEPDIIVTDIRMPFLDGLQSVQALREKRMNAKFILLSGYSEFEYARKAIELGVNHYVLKPIEKLELAECIQGVIAELEEERRNSAEMKRMRADHTLNELMHVQFSKAEAAQLLLEIGIDPRMHAYVCALAELGSSGQSVSTFEWHQAFHENVIPSITGLLLRPFRVSEREAGLLVGLRSPSVEAMLPEAIERVRQALATNFRTDVTFGLGTVAARPHLLTESFQSARYALGCRLIRGRNAVIGPVSPFGSARTKAESRFDRSEDIAEAIELLDESRLTSIIGELFMELRQERNAGPADIQMRSLQTVLAAVNGLTPGQAEELSHLAGLDVLSLDEILRSTSIEDIQARVTQITLAIVALKRLHRVSRQQDIIGEFKQYIADNYAEPITLITAADKFFLNPNYIGQLFKKKTGQTFLDYLTQVRVQEAKRLLALTDLKVYEVSSRVGYRDTKHFSQLFERLVGCTPSKFRSNENMRSD